MEIDWDRAARFYALQTALERAPVKALVRLAAVRAEDRVLDVGTGTGAVLREMARLGEPPERVAGLDASRAMLARVWGLPHRWKLHRGDARDLPFEDGSFDLLTMGYLLHLLAETDRAAALAEAARVLSPRGRLATLTVAEIGPLSGALLGPIARRARRGGGALLGLVPLDPRPGMIAAGFEPVALTKVRLGYPSLCVVAQPILS